jgi:SAM-dependent methyltransferase
MSNFRDFLFNRDPSAAWALAVAMTGVRMGERQLLVGDDAALFARLAAKAGLTGRASVVTGSEAAAARVEAAAAESGVLIEAIRRAAFPELPVDDAAFDVAIVNAGPSFLALVAHERDTLAAAVHRALRPGGRVVVVEGRPPRFFGLVRARPAGLADFHAAGGAARVLEATGFRGVRVLADRDGQRFTEGTKPAADVLT